MALIMCFFAVACADNEGVSVTDDTKKEAVQSDLETLWEDSATNQNQKIEYSPVIFPYMLLKDSTYAIIEWGEEVRSVCSDEMSAYDGSFVGYIALFCDQLRRISK